MKEWKKNKTKQQCNNSIEAKFIKWKELLLPNMQQRESFILIMIILFLIFMLIFKAFRGKKLHLIQEFNNALKMKIYSIYQSTNSLLKYLSPCILAQGGDVEMKMCTRRKRWKKINLALLAGYNQEPFQN